MTWGGGWYRSQGQVYHFRFQVIIVADSLLCSLGKAATIVATTFLLCVLLILEKEIDMAQKLSIDYHHQRKCGPFLILSLMDK